MAVRLVFLGRLEDISGAPEREVPAAASLDALLGSLEPDLAAALRAERIRMAHNGTLVAGRGEGLVLADGDELAFLPPVSGG